MQTHPQSNGGRSRPLAPVHNDGLRAGQDVSRFEPALASVPAAHLSAAFWNTDFVQRISTQRGQMERAGQRPAVRSSHLLVLLALALATLIASFSVGEPAPTTARPHAVERVAP